MPLLPSSPYVRGLRVEGEKSVAKSRKRRSTTTGNLGDKTLFWLPLGMDDVTFGGTRRRIKGWKRIEVRNNTVDISGLAGVSKLVLRNIHVHTVKDTLFIEGLD